MDLSKLYIKGVYHDKTRQGKKMQRVRHKEGLISPFERHFLVALAQDKYYRATTSDEIIDTCVDKYKTKKLNDKEGS